MASDMASCYHPRTLFGGLRTSVVLAVFAVALVVFGWQLVDERALRLLQDNAAAGTREQILPTTLSVALGSMIFGLGYVAATGTRGELNVQRIVRLLAPLPLVAFAPALLIPGSFGDALPTAMAIAAFTVAFESLLRVSLREIQTIEAISGEAAVYPRFTSRSWPATVTVLACAAFYAFYMSKYTIYSHRRFGTYGYDLGQYDNVFWSTLHGHPLRCAPLGLVSDWQHIGNHADLATFFLLPFYAIKPGAETLLIMQACILALGAIPLYLFAARRLPPFYAATLAICYLAYPPLHGANFYDFHFQPIATTLILALIYFIDSRRWVLAAVIFVMALSCREDTSIGLTVLGLYLLYTGYRPRAGAIMAASAAMYFVVIKFVVMPRFWQSWFSDMYKDLYPQPDGARTFGGVIQTLATNPSYVFRTLLTADKLRYFLQIITPLAFLPLRRAYLLPALVPGTIITLLTTGYAPTIDIGFQYTAHFTSYIFPAAALMLTQYRSEPEAATKTRAALAALAVATVLCTLQWGAFPPRGIRSGFAYVDFRPPSAADAQKERDLAELFAMIPPDALYAVAEQELPHVSGRLTIRSLKYDTSGAEYLLYGTTSMGADVGARALARGEYVEVAQRPGLMLLKRKP
jgi:uncharacterized membrane protein